MVKWTAVIIPLALATAAYLFYSRHQGSAASTASRNENLPDDKDDEVNKIKNITIRSQVLNPHFFWFFSTGPSSAAAATAATAPTPTTKLGTKTTATTTAWKQS